MEANWRSYITLIDDHPALVLVDIGARECADEALPHLITLRLRALALEENGLPTEEDFEAIYALEEALDACVQECGGRYVGRYTHGEEYVLHAYTARPEETLAAVQALADQHGDRAPACEVTEDAAWETYFGALHPSREEWREMIDEEVLAQLQENGDDLSQPREIEHWFSFDDPEKRAQAEKALVKNKFKVSSRSEPSEEDAGFGLCAVRVDSVQPDEITELTISLMELAEHFDGEYDGWGTHVVE
jgi:uncharacterized protein (TIGR01619 family)